MERRILSVLQRMQEHLNENQLRELKTVLQMVFHDCELVQKTEVMVVDSSWRGDMEDFLMSKALEGKSVSTVNRYRYELNRLLSYVNKAVCDISEGEISGYMRTYKTTCNISNQTLQNVRAVFSTFFVWLRDRDRIRKNPMILVENIKVEKKIKKPFSDSEKEKLLRNCEKLRDLAMMEFLYSTAVRVSELVALNIEDVRFGESDLIVYGKGGKERVVYLNEKTNLYMKEYLNSRDDTNPALFVSSKSPHERLSKAGVEYILRTIGKRAMVQKTHPHRFRRTALTNALNRGMPLQEAMILAGHSKPETTMRYCSVDQEGVKYHHKKYLSA